MSGEIISINELNNIYAETFSQNDIPDKIFTSNDLSNGYLYVPDVLPGNVTVIDNNNKVVMAEQSQKIQQDICIGVLINLSNTIVNGTWKIRYNRGMRGQPGISSNEMPVTEELIKYAIIFG